MTIRTLLRTGAALGALVAMVSMAPAAAYAQEFEIDVRHTVGTSAISGDGEHYALIEGASGDTSQKMTIRNVNSNAIEAEFARPGERFFYGRPQISRDGSTTIVTACQWQIDSGMVFCELYRADLDSEELTELEGIDDTVNPYGTYPVSYVMTPDGSGIYFANFRRYDVGLGQMFTIVMGADLCTDEMAAPYDFRECVLRPAGPGGSWLLVEARDFSGERGAEQEPVFERTTAYIVESETGSNEQVFQVTAPDYAEMFAATHDGGSVFFSRTAGGSTMAYYLWERDAAGEPQRVDLLPNGTTPAQSEIYTAYRGDMSPDGRYIAYLAHPQAEAPVSVFVRDLKSGTTRLASPTEGDAALDGSVLDVQVSDDGTVVLFSSDARNIDSNGPQLPPVSETPLVTYLARFLVAVTPGDEAVTLTHHAISDPGILDLAAVSTNSDNPIRVSLEDLEEGVFAQNLVVRSLHSGTVLAEFAVPGEEPEDGARYFNSATVSADGSTIVAKACVLDFGVIECHWYRADVETESLVPLPELDALDLRAAPQLSRDGQVAYFPDDAGIEPRLARIDLGTGAMTEVVIAEGLCDDALAAPATRRICGASSVGAGDNWFVLAAYDRTPGGDGQPGATFRTTMWLVNAETGDIDEIFSVGHAFSGGIRHVSDDGESVLYVISSEAESASVYLWQRDSPEAPERIDVLPDGAFPPTVAGTQQCPGGTAAMTPDGRFVAYTARPEASAFPSVFLRDLETGEITLMSPAVEDVALDGCTSDLFLGDDGRTVTFLSQATNIESEGPALDGEDPALFVSRLGEPVEEPPAEFRLILPNVVRQLMWP